MPKSGRYASVILLFGYPASDTISFVEPVKDDESRFLLLMGL
jgi:hypothetical protein